MRLLIAAVGLVLPLAAAAAPAFTVAPVVLSGDPVGLVLDGLPPRSRVAITAKRRDAEGTQLAATATFAADARGRVDVARARPLPGSSYTRADDAGLFWSMARTAPVSDLGEGIVDLVATVQGATVAHATFRLDRGRPDLVTTPVAAAPGAFVVAPPADGRRHGAIIVLGGSEGGASAARGLAPRLAARGFVVLGFPYYSPAYGGAPEVAGLPAAFADIPVDRLQQARDILAARSDVDPARIGVYGVSKGAELALLAATKFDWLKAVVAIVPSDVVWEGWGKPVPAATLSSFAWQGRPLPFIPYDDIMAEFTKAARGEQMSLRGPHERGKALHPELLAAARIRIEDYRGPLLVAGGGDDQIWPSLEMTRAIAATRRRAGRTTVALTYPRAGHGLSGDGYGPTTTNGIGGTPPANAAAQADLWPRTLAFLQRALGR